MIKGVPERFFSINRESRIVLLHSQRSSSRARPRALRECCIDATKSQAEKCFRFRSRFEKQAAKCFNGSWEKILRKITAGCYYHFAGFRQSHIFHPPCSPTKLEKSIIYSRRQPDSGYLLAFDEEPLIFGQFDRLELRCHRWRERAVDSFVGAKAVRKRERDGADLARQSFGHRCGDR